MMNNEELDEIAESWIKATKTRFDFVENDYLDWAIDKMIDLPRVDPDTAWEIIMAILKKSPPSKVISQLGAGPLEDIMRYHGDIFMAKIENMVSENKLFKECMKSVWLDKEDLDSYKKFYELAGIAPPFDD